MNDLEILLVLLGKRLRAGNVSLIEFDELVISVFLLAAVVWVVLREHASVRLPVVLVLVLVNEHDPLISFFAGHMSLEDVVHLSAVHQASRVILHQRLRLRFLGLGQALLLFMLLIFRAFLRRVGEL
jgi:hypothetical protein